MNPENEIKLLGKIGQRIKGNGKNTRIALPKLLTLLYKSMSDG